MKSPTEYPDFKVVPESYAHTHGVTCDVVGCGLPASHVGRSLAAGEGCWLCKHHARQVQERLAVLGAKP